MVTTFFCTYSLMNLFFIDLKVENFKDLITDRIIEAMGEDQISDEQIIRYTTKQNMVRNRMYALYSEGLPYFITENTFPVGKLTLAFSLMIATDPQYRKAFYTYFTGQVPFITQFILNYFRFGFLTDNIVLNKFKGDELLFGLSTFCPFFNETDPKEQIFEFVRWFENLALIEEQLKSSYFQTYVPLSKIAIWCPENERVILPVLNPVDGSLISNPKFEFKSRSFKRYFESLAQNIKLELKASTVANKQKNSLDNLSVLYYPRTKNSFIKKFLSKTQKT